MTTGGPEGEILGPAQWTLGREERQQGESTACPGCGLLLPVHAGPTHAYLGASPACLRLYGRASSLSWGQRDGLPLLRLVVDAYGAQHPGVRQIRSVQSVAVHLMGLCTILERGAHAEPRLVPTRDRQPPPPARLDLHWLEPPRPIEVVIYDPEIFDRQFAGLFRFSAAGFYAGVIRVRGDTVLGSTLSRVLHHELVHAALDAAMPSAVLPGWLNEGLAEWFEARAAGKRRLSDREFAVLAHFRGQGALFSLAQLSSPSFVGFGPEAASLAYLQSYGMLTYLARISDERALRGMVEELVRTRNLARAIQRAFRADLAELEARFQAELG